MATAVASPIPPPPTSGNLQLPPWKSNSVDRSKEFLSAARTALKIAQARHRQQLQEEQAGNNYNGNSSSSLPEWMVDLNPLELRLYAQQPTAYDDHDDATSLIRDSQTLLSLLDTHLTELHSLVRRRGHTNDPTVEIQSIMERFQEGAREVKDVCDSLRLAGTRPCNNNLHYGHQSSSKSSSQRRKHYELVSLQLEGQAKERTDRLKKELETRSKVLRDQSHRRKLLASGGGGGGSGQPSPMNAMNVGSRSAQPSIKQLPPSNKVALNASSQFQSPLFTATSGGGGGRNASSSSPYSGYAGYGGASPSATSTSTAAGKAGGGYAGYGGTTSAPPSFATGMRQRKQQQPQPKSHIQIDSGGDNDDHDDKYNKSADDNGTSVHQQISLRRQKRATQSRAQQARLAERSIAELGVMFTKMSTLISHQGEVLERIEDDVEAAGGDIDAGHDELVKVYGMTRGNRGLILKVFAILIFLIIFMKLY